MKKIKYKKNVRKRKLFYKKLTRKISWEKDECESIYFFYKFIKFIFLSLLIFFNSFCSKYSKRILNYYYTKRVRFLRLSRRPYNESNIITIQDKLNWLSIHDVKKLKGKCADKILIHEYSKRILKKDICNKILKVYDNPDQINIDELPDQFVLKTNHGSGFNIIVQNKSKLNVERAKMKLAAWLKFDFGADGAQFHYSFIKRKAFAEEYIGKDLCNYKFLCFNGIPRYLYLSKRYGIKNYLTYFDMEWNRLDFHCVGPPHPTDIYPKPKNFELMKKYATKLSRPFKFVRVDFYEYNNEVRLGEMTFTPTNCDVKCKNKEHNIELGKYLKIF